MNRSLYEVTMSADGAHKVTVRIEDPGGTDAALTWARATHSKLMQSEANPPDTGNGLGDVPVCAFHRVPMAYMNGRKGPFWSCHEKNLDGSWCSYRPSHAGS